jgi:hypothetical protein
LRVCKHFFPAWETKIALNKSPPTRRSSFAAMLFSYETQRRLFMFSLLSLSRLLHPHVPSGRSSVTGNRLSRLVSLSAVSFSSVSFPSNGPVVSCPKPSQPVSFGRSLRRAFPPLPLKKEKEKNTKSFGAGTFADGNEPIWLG